MNTALRLFLGIIILCALLMIVHLLRKQRLNLQYSLIWLFSVVVLLVLIIFPDIVVDLSHIVGVEAPVNFVYVVEAVFVLLILLSLTTIISKLNEQIRRLTQSIALLEKRIRELEKK